jgi:hypothetical protein
MLPVYGLSVQTSNALLQGSQIIIIALLGGIQVVKIIVSHGYLSTLQGFLEVDSFGDGYLSWPFCY